MIQTQAPVADVGRNGPFIQVVLNVPEIAPQLAPGRFVLADLGAYIRTPLFPAGSPTGSDTEAFEVLVPPEHPAATLRPGATVDLIGPLGRGFDVPTPARRLLLVADTVHLPVLLPLTGQQPGFVGKPGFSVALLLSAPSAAELPPLRLLPPALEVHIVTADGSSGHPGSALDLFPDLARWADCVCVADDPATYPALADLVREVRIGPGPRFAQALVVPPMACGLGACQGCAVHVAHGIKLACTDGPVFDLLELR